MILFRFQIITASCERSLKLDTPRLRSFSIVLEHGFPQYSLFQIAKCCPFRLCLAQKTMQERHEIWGLLPRINTNFKFHYKLTTSNFQLAKYCLLTLCLAQKTMQEETCNLGYSGAGSQR